mgnify:CR=1 FL=1
MIDPDIAFALTGDLNRNSRALKQLSSLAGSGFTVRVFHLGGDSPAAPLPDTVHASIVRVSAGSGPMHFLRVHRAFRDAIGACRARLFHASDLYVLAACRRASDRFRVPFTYDARELYPHVAATTGRPWARWWWQRVEGKHIRSASAVFTVSDSIADSLSKTYTIDRPTLVQNTPLASATYRDDTADAEPNLRELLGGSSERLILHLGQMKKARGCENLVRAMKTVERAHLVFLGYGPLKTELQRLTSEQNLDDRVHFLDPVSPAAIHSTIRSADIGVTLLEDTCLNHRYALPNKLFDYLLAGLPVLGSDLQEVSRLMDDHDVGLCVNASSPQAIGNALNDMLLGPRLSKWRRNALKASETFRWETASQHLMNEFIRLLSPSSSVS